MAKIKHIRIYYFENGKIDELIKGQTIKERKNRNTALKRALIKILKKQYKKRS